MKNGSWADDAYGDHSKGLLQSRRRAPRFFELDVTGSTVIEGQGMGQISDVPSSRDYGDFSRIDYVSP